MDCRVKPGNDELLDDHLPKRAGMGNFVLVAGWRTAHGFERFVQQFGRGDNMPSAGPEWKGFVDMCL